jgi:glycosyltransferase involved in cell wall biosynthesis
VSAGVGKRIGIDARFYGLGSAGLARYTQELVEHIARAKTPHTFVVFIRTEDKRFFRSQRRNIEVRTTDIPHYSFQEQLFLKKEIESANLDLMHFTNFNFPLWYRDPFIISINDLTLLRFSGRSKLSRFKVGPMRHVMQVGANKSLEVLTYSDFQKKLITRNFDVPAEKVIPIYLAVDEQFKVASAKQIAAFRKAKGLDKPFVMYTGQWREHKNLVRLIKAFKVVRKQWDGKLVLVGKKDDAFPIIPQTIAEQGLEGDVILTGFVKDEELPLYYNAAEVFAFPSLAEGFGLPPLEAMACGTSVASSNAGPMPEILGNAADYFNPRSTKDVAETLVKLLKNSKRRETYQKRGLAQVKKYSWGQTASETLASYERALQQTEK